jgi:hypothetical protein
MEDSSHASNGAGEQRGHDGLHGVTRCAASRGAPAAVNVPVGLSPRVLDRVAVSCRRRGCEPHADYMDLSIVILLPRVDMLMGTFCRPPRGLWHKE